MKTNRYCVIMCGGVGSRFWPHSRSGMPKQFIDFFGMGKSLLQMTVERISTIVDHEHIVLVTNSSYYEIVREQLPEIKESNILLEPARKNTAPCICWAAHHIAALDPEAVMVVLPSDHLVMKEAAFQKAVEEGLDFVENGDRLLTLGIKPSSPHTGYGYIQKGVSCVDHNGILKVKSFTEKPNLEMAQFFLSSGEFFWNSGIFLWSAKSILAAFEKYAPDIANIFDSGAPYYATPEERTFIMKAFPTSPSISIDYAIMERASNVFMKTVDVGWSDLGSWKSLYEVSPRNAEGNVTQNCKVLTRDCSGNIFAVKGDKIIVAAGLKDYIVADNGNALLIYPIADEQKIRQVVNDVKSRFGEEFV